jgi:hypothetical protein
VRNYNFASSQYVSAFGNLPLADVTQLRVDAVNYIKDFDSTTWYANPIDSILKGENQVGVEGEVFVTTVDAFNEVNGMQVLSPPTIVDSVIQHMKQYKYEGDLHALKAKIRVIEQKLLTDRAAELVGNQALDFKKQDGVTEIEESIEANKVERELNDQLLRDEEAGQVAILRNPALIGCVSNFSNFLDLFRKTLRNIELGVPVVVLSRSNTSQHCFRWADMLISMLNDAGVDNGLVSFASCTIEEQRRIMKACPDSPLYLTGSRPVSKAIKELLPKTFSSTGGPNTMVAAELTDEVKQAIRWSTMIENSGQCTAMRHLVVSDCEDDLVPQMFTGKDVEVITCPSDSLSKSGFAGLYKGWGDTFTTNDLSYKIIDGVKVPIAYRHGTEYPHGIEEHWRRVFLDVTKDPKLGRSEDNKEFASGLSKWLVAEQPITLAINGDNARKGHPLTNNLFEQTAQVVYSVGADGNNVTPCLTCQARPQDGEIFGEFPPRRELGDFTRFPVIVPSSTPGYNTEYRTDFLAKVGASGNRCAHEGNAVESVRNLLGYLESAAVKGYCTLLAEYILDACAPQNNPRNGFGKRTALWGLQKPPRVERAGVRRPSFLVRVNRGCTMDDVAAYLVPFLLTNAGKELFVSFQKGVDTEKMMKNLKAVCHATSIHDAVVQTDAEFYAAAKDSDAWQILSISSGGKSSSDEAVKSLQAPFSFREQDMKESGPSGLPLVGHFASLLFPLGHIKSSMSNDTKFVSNLKESDKWLRTYK